MPFNLNGTLSNKLSNQLYRSDQCEIQLTVRSPPVLVLTLTVALSLPVVAGEPDGPRTTSTLHKPGFDDMVLDVVVQRPVGIGAMVTGRCYLLFRCRSAFPATASAVPSMKWCASRQPIPFAGAWAAYPIIQIDRRATGTLSSPQRPVAIAGSRIGNPQERKRTDRHVGQRRTGIQSRDTRNS